MGNQGVRSEDEPALVERAKSDPDAFGELYERHFDRIYAFALSRLLTRTEAEDATSEIFFKALRGIPRYRETELPFSAWLFRIATNVVIDRYRRRRPTSSLEDAHETLESTDIADAVLTRARMVALWAAVDTLPRQQRIALKLRYSADLSNSAIAGLMGKSTPAIKLLIHRGVRALRGKVVEGNGTMAEGDLTAQYV